MRRGSLLPFLLLSFCCALAAAQNASLRGHVSDETGAFIPGATITATAAGGKPFTTRSAADGGYAFNALPAGNYRIEAAYTGFAMKQPPSFTAHGQAGTLNLVLSITTVSQQVDVAATDASTVSLNSANNASATVLSGSKLDALADDPDDLAADLQALAGPSAGPSGSAFYIDGFSSGDMPPKESIREIRINQNPFSPEYDKLGLGRIEIFTRPGSDKFHGNISMNYGTDDLNSRNPYASVKAPFQLREYGISLVGPVNDHASFTFDSRFEDTANGAVINGAALDPVSLAIVSPYSAVFSVPQHQFLISPKLDYQLGANHTLTARFRATNVAIADSGLGGSALVESAYHAQALSQTTQLVDTMVLNANAVNETRFQFYNVNSTNIARNPGPSIQVLNAFTGGGSTVGTSSDVQRNYELQNLTTLNRGNHVLHFGLRARDTSDSSLSQQNFNGTYTFAGVTAPQLDANNNPVIGTNGQPLLVTLTSLQQYQRTLLLERVGLASSQIRALGGGASQFGLSAGNTALSASQADLSLFLGDTWKIRPNLSLDAGLRYEVQNNISDRRDLAPRVAISWAPMATHQKLVLRAGYGIFYDRFALGNTLSVLRYNGLNQQQYIVSNPDFFPSVPAAATLAASTSSRVTQVNAPDLRAPLYSQILLSVERQLPLHTALAVSFANTRGVHQLRSEDINAPLPGGGYPLGNANPVFEAQSEGIYKQTQMIVNLNTQATRNISLFGSYTLGYAHSNTDGLGTFSANPYSMAGEYGPAASDVRHFETFGGSIQARWKTTFSPLLTVRSGAPFNITAGRDLYGTTLYNGRPGIAVDPGRAGLVQTSYGLLDPNPTSGETLVTRNSGRGPGSILFNLRASKTIGFGTARGSSDSGGKQERKPRYTVVLNVQARNLTNHNNPGPIIGNLSSPLFGRANQAAGSAPQNGAQWSESATNRRFEFVARFTF